MLQSSTISVVREYHLKMDSADLMAFVQHFTNRIWKEVITHISTAAKTPELYHALRQGIERELREHVTAMDLCGMSALCDLAAEINPWPDPQKPSSAE